MSRVRPAPLFALLLCAACSTPRSGSQGGEIVRPEALPTNEREAWELYHAGGAKWELERERVLADPNLSRFLVDNLVREMVKSYDRSRLAHTGEQQGPFERACDELVLLQKHSIPVLAEMLGLRDGIVAFLASELLVRIGAPANEPVRNKLDDPTPEVRRRASELLGRLPPAGEREVALEEHLGRIAQNDKAWIVRAQAAQALGARGSRHTHKGYAAGVLARCLSDADPAVSESAAKGLLTLAEPRAIPFLIDALERNSARGDLAALRTTQEALRGLSGEKQDRGPEEWRAWWRETGERKLVH